MANPILEQAVRRKLRESHAQGLKDGSIKMPEPVKPEPRLIGRGAAWFVWYVVALAVTAAVAVLVWL
jgi:hypothetical protein